MPGWLNFCVVKRVEYGKLKLWYFYNIKLISLLALITLRPKGWDGLAMYSKWQMIEWSKNFMNENWYVQD
jgi:hypothetical protein